MNDKDKDIAETLAEAVKALPEDKREFLLGYAEGVAAMADKRSQEQAGEDAG